jgi:hypothetical protein
MERLIICAFFLSSFTLSSCAPEPLYSRNDLMTIAIFGERKMVLLRETERSNFKNTHLVLIDDGKILASEIMDDPAFYLFDKISKDTVYIKRIVHVQEARVRDFQYHTRTFHLKNAKILVKDYPSFGSGRLMLDTCTFQSSYIAGEKLIAKCAGQLKEYSLSNLFFKNEAIYYYEYSQNTVGASLLGYQKKQTDDFRPFNR